MLVKGFTCVNHVALTFSLERNELYEINWLSCINGRIAKNELVNGEISLVEFNLKDSFVKELA